MTKIKVVLFLSILFASDFSNSDFVRAQTPYFQGKTVTIIVGTGAGDLYDLYARAIALFMGKHLAGNPNSIVQNMPGAGQRKQLDLDPTTGEEVQGLANEVMSQPKDVIERLRKMMGK